MERRQQTIGILLDADIIQINSDGSGQSLLANASAPVFFVEADGTPDDPQSAEIVINEREGNAAESLVKVRSSSGNLREIADNGLNTIAHPRWNARKTKVVYAGLDSGGDRGIFVVDSNGNSRIQVGGTGFSPTWTSDDRIAFIQNGDIWLVDDNGANLERFSFLGDVSSADWSIDGTAIVLLRGRDIWLLLNVF